MKCLILLLMILLPIGILAQEVDSNPKGDDRSATSSELAGSIHTTDFGSVSFGSSGKSNLAFPFGLGLGAAQQSKRKTSKRARESERPRIERSMVGYIDNAIVGSEVRIRFDAAFNDSNPDLAEFFYAKCGCYRGAGLDPNAPGPPPGTAVVVPRTLNFQQLYFDAEYALNRRFSVFTEVPLRWIQPQGFVVGNSALFPNEGGLGDIMPGFKVAVLEAPNYYLTVQARAYLTSGNATKGLGTNHTSIEPRLLYYQRFTNRWAMEAQVGDWVPTSGSAGVPSSTATTPGRFSGNVFFYGFGPSYKLYDGLHVKFAPVVEIVGWRVNGGYWTEIPGPVSGVAGKGAGINIVNAKVGARTAFGPHDSIYVGYGHALTSMWWYQDIVRIEYRHSF